MTLPHQVKVVGGGFPFNRPGTIAPYSATAWTVCCPACGKSGLIGEPFSRHVFTVHADGTVSTNGSIICQNRRRGVKCEAHYTITANVIAWHGPQARA